MARPKKPEAAPGNALRAHLDDVRQSRADAEHAGSWSAVAAMRRLEFDVIRAIWERASFEAETKRRKQEEEAAAADPGQVIGQIVQIVNGMPTALRARLLAELGAPADLAN